MEPKHAVPLAGSHKHRRDVEEPKPDWYGTTQQQQHYKRCRRTSHTAQRCDKHMEDSFLWKRMLHIEYLTSIQNTLLNSNIIYSINLSESTASYYQSTTAPSYLLLISKPWVQEFPVLQPWEQKYTVEILNTVIVSDYSESNQRDWQSMPPWTTGVDLITQQKKKSKFNNLESSTSVFCLLLLKRMEEPELRMQCRICEQLQDKK